MPCFRPAATLCLALLGPLAAAASPPADLRLEWLEGGAAVREAGPVRGRAGEVVHLTYRLRNVGGGAAFAAVLTAHTALGPASPPARLEPGPRPGEARRRELALPLATGMRELCLEALLQRAAAEDPPDPNPQDNLLCRPVEVSDPAASDPSRTPSEIPPRDPEGAAP